MVLRYLDDKFSLVYYICKFRVSAKADTIISFFVNIAISTYIFLLKLSKSVLNLL